MPVDLSALPFGSVPPAVLFMGAAMALAVLACLALMFGGGGARRKVQQAEDAARGLKAEIRSLSAERDAAKTDHGLAEQNFRYIAEKIGLDNFTSDHEKKAFIDAVGGFARDGEIRGLLKARQVDLHSALGMSGEELSDLMTFRNHINPEWVRQPAKAARSLDLLANRLSAIAQMETVWRDKTSTVAEARQLLADNMWVFEPDYVVSKGRMFTDRTIASIGSALVPGSSVDDGSGLRPDIVAMTALSASLQSGHQWRDIHRTAVLIVDLKGTGTRIGIEETQKASSYARELMKAKVAKANAAFDCYVVGKEVDEDEGAPRVEGWMGNVRVTPLSYDQLIARAKRLTLDLARVLAQTPERFEDKVHTLPAAEPDAPEAMAADELDQAHDVDERQEAQGDGHHDDHDGHPEGEVGPDGKPVKPKDPHAQDGEGHAHDHDHDDGHHGERHDDAPRRRMAAE